MIKNPSEAVKKVVEGLKVSVAKVKELAKGNKYDPAYREIKHRLKRAQRKLDRLSGKKTIRNKKKST